LACQCCWPDAATAAVLLMLLVLLLLLLHREHSLRES
jgi:hypothetical protein